MEALREVVSRAAVAISADYRGLNVKEMTALRRRLRAAGAEVHVVKNTLLRIAAERAGRPDLASIAQGPTAIAFGFDDPVAVAKALTEHIRTQRLTVSVTAGYVDGQVIGPAQVSELATLPNRDTLLAQLMGTLNGPLASFAALIGAPLQQLYGLVDARATQLEGAA